MMRNEDFSEGYFSGRLWASTWQGQGDSFAADVKETIETAVIGTLDWRFWSEGFCYGAKAERSEQLSRGETTSNDSDDDSVDPTAEEPGLNYRRDAA